ncbi:MAG: alpha/beta hydrolase [Proteobacteria bacterium]|nr:alpha/beta hydrolase [Pseudomonadota bacterium]
MATFVLVHGAWHGGWCWRRVSDRLRAKGHDVYAPTLTGLGERSHLLSPMVGLETHIQDIVNVLKFEELTDVILCGHSYAGMVITGVIDREPDRISALVYLDAFVPSDGDCAMDHTKLNANGALQRAVDERGDGWRMPLPAMEAMGVFDHADIDWVEHLLVEHPVKSFNETLSLTGSPDHASRHYILASGGTAPRFAHVHARMSEDPNWSTYEVPTGHDVMVTMPAELSDILDKIAG